MKRVSIEKDFGFLTRDVTSEKTFQSESEHKKVRNEYSCISPCMSVTVVKCSKYEFISRECSCCMCACMRERGGERESLTVVSPFYFFQSKRFPTFSKTEKVGGKKSTIEDI